MHSWPSVVVPETREHLPDLTLNGLTGPITITNQIDHFRMYVCGITPYDATHLGHAATYLTFDLINRYLTSQGISVQFVENITDIDDPLFERAARDNQSWQELGNSQVALFQSDMTALRIMPPVAYESVTDSMSEIILAIEKLAQNGSIYQLESDWYFKISDFLNELPLAYADALKIFGERGGDPEKIGKENPLDPVIWIGNKSGEPGWDSKLGFGRPGWHIECVVIALANLVGDTYLTSSSANKYQIDLQGGGSDLIFPHHFMTAAMTKSLTGYEFAQTYLHAGMVGLDGEKMSKSKGNLVLVSNLLKSGYDAMVIRFALLNEHFATDRMWRDTTIQEAQNRVDLIRSALSRNEVAPTSDTISKIAKALANNLDTPSALNALDNWVRETESGATGGSVGELSRFLDTMLGLAL